MRKLATMASMALMLGIAAPSWSCTEHGPVLPTDIDPLTAANDLPCVDSSTVRPSPGAVMFYKEGQLGNIDMRGNITLGGGRDTTRLDAFSYDGGISRGEQILILKSSQESAGRALDYSEVIP